MQSSNLIQWTKLWNYQNQYHCAQKVCFFVHTREKVLCNFWPCFLALPFCEPTKKIALHPQRPLFPTHTFNVVFCSQELISCSWSHSVLLLILRNLRVLRKYYDFITSLVLGWLMLIVVAAVVVRCHVENAPCKPMHLIPHMQNTAWNVDSRTHRAFALFEVSVGNLVAATIYHCNRHPSLSLKQQTGNMSRSGTLRGKWVAARWGAADVRRLMPDVGWQVLESVIYIESSHPVLLSWGFNVGDTARCWC